MPQTIIQKLLSALSGKPKPTQSGVTKNLGDGYVLWHEYAPNGLGGYHPVNASLWHNGQKVRQLTDGEGAFCQFPGVVHGSWEAKQTSPFQPRVRFTLWAGPFQEGKSRIEWMLQPDGRYYADEDGFGWEKDEEILLYGLMDTTGTFIVPFSYEKP